MDRSELAMAVQRDADGHGVAVPAEAARPARSRRGRVLAVLAVVAVVAAGVWAYRSNFAADRPAMDMNMRIVAGAIPFPVTLVPAAREAMRGSVMYTGTVAAFNEEDIFPRVTGRIVEMTVYPGDSVRAGQVVARLDDLELDSRVREAAGTAAAAEAGVAQGEAEVLAARHGVAQMERELAMATAEIGVAREGVSQMEKELAMAEAEAGYQESVSAREERLFASGAVSRQDVENAQAMVATARARVAAARAKAEQARAMVAASQAKREAARARLDQARAMETAATRKREAMAAMAAQGQAMLRTAQIVRDYVEIRAPSTGWVVKRLVAPGVLVQPGMPVLKIAQIDRVRLQANVGERDVGSIKVGSLVTVSATATAQPPFTARVTSVFPFVEPGARTAVVEAVVDNPDRRLLPGQYVSLEFTTGERADAVTVPRQAVSRLGDRRTVWVARDGKAEPRTVTTGLESADRTEIRQGVSAGEMVVARGHEGLYAGARITDVTARGGPAPGGHDQHQGMPSPAPASPAATGGGMPSMPGMETPARDAETPARKEGGHAGH